MERLFIALTALSAGATLAIPNLAKAQISIEELQQRSQGTIKTSNNVMQLEGFK
ncbi:hypothetical protein [Myxosarcina sp. GI1]|uniref:hypothetical protein n=1 Tax=Myxosarcina sp. GI1 TaxID=1541065 RepID=UPI0012E074F5|nr:hypothetical protein [Myxosarcina sp. GI1]